MTGPRTPPPARVRQRRLQIDDAAPTGDDNARPVPSAEGQFEYGESLSQSPSVRYRQIKAVEGGKAAREYAKAQLLRMHFSGVTDHEAAHVLGVSVDWVKRVAREAREEVRQRASSGFDGMGVVAEHMALYKQLRENAFFAMSKTGVQEVDRHRARESLLSVMAKEIDFIDRVGGLRGVSLQGAAEDENVLAARRLAGSIEALQDRLADVLADDLDDDGIIDGGDGSTRPDADGLYEDEDRGEAWEPDAESDPQEGADALEGPQW